MNNCGNSDRLQEYTFKKQLPMIKKYIDESVCCNGERRLFTSEGKYKNFHGCEKKMEGNIGFSEC